MRLPTKLMDDLTSKNGVQYKLTNEWFEKHGIQFMLSTGRLSRKQTSEKQFFQGGFSFGILKKFTKIDQY